MILRPFFILLLTMTVLVPANWRTASAQGLGPESAAGIAAIALGFQEVCRWKVDRERIRAFLKLHSGNTDGEKLAESMAKKIRADMQAVQKTHSARMELTCEQMRGQLRRQKFLK